MSKIRLTTVIFNAVTMTATGLALGIVTFQCLVP